MNIRIWPDASGGSTLSAPPPSRTTRTVRTVVLVAGLSGAGGHIDPTAVCTVQTSSTVHSEHLSELSRVASLPVGWDDEGAPPPSHAAVSAASRALESLLADGLSPNEIDADVNGGVAISLHSGRSSRRVWVVCPNVGRAHAVLHGDPTTPARALELGEDWVREVSDYLGRA